MKQMGRIRVYALSDTHQYIPAALLSEHPVRLKVLYAIIPYSTIVKILPRNSY